MEQELITLGILFFFALVGGILASKFKQPMLMGLLVVGAFIGPHMFGLVKDIDMIRMMIDFGAILMLFMIGLEFDLSKLKKIGLKAMVVGMLKSAIVVFIGFNVGLLLGLGTQTSLFIGIILAFSSTVVIVKILEERDLMDRQEVPLIIAVLIIEDILAVIMLTFFSGIRDKTVGMIGNIQNLVIAICILILVYMAFVKFVKPIIEWLVRTNNSDEIMTFLALTLCAGFSYLAYHLNLSPAAGAFLAGSIVASLPEAKRFGKAISPYNLIISSLFFIAVGTMVNFHSVQQNIMLILILVLTVILTRLLAFGLIVYLFANFRGDKMFFSSMAMFSVGEFALLIAQESQKFNIGIDLMSISAAIIFITAMLMSLTLNYSNKLYHPTNESIPYGFRRKLEKYSNYIRAISEELDLDNKHSQNLKNNLFGVMIGLLVTLLTIFGWRKIITLMIEYNTSGAIIMLGYVATLTIIALSIFYVMFRLKHAIRTLSDIFSNATNHRNAGESKTIVRTAFIACGILTIALTFPFIMFMFNLKPIYVIIPFALLIIFAWQVYRLSRNAGHDYTEQYASSQRITYPIKHGWKI
jgi:CPA2 family monovalent cation:H+ antiporter-2